MNLQPVLIGECVALRPLAEADYADLYHAATDPRIWEQHPDKKEIRMLPQILIAASAAIVFILGVLHLHGTFFGSDLRPRDPVLEARMKEVAAGASTDTTIWNGWIAFNAAASFGFLMFGALYGYLAIVQFHMLLQAKFFLLIGACFLMGMVVVSARYLFRIPVVAFGLCLLLYVAGAAVAMDSAGVFKDWTFSTRCWRGSDC